MTVTAVLLCPMTFSEAIAAMRPGARHMMSFDKFMAHEKLYKRRISLMAMAYEAKLARARMSWRAISARARSIAATEAVSACLVGGVWYHASLVPWRLARWDKHKYGIASGMKLVSCIKSGGGI